MPAPCHLDGSTAIGGAAGSVRRTALCWAALPALCWAALPLLCWAALPALRSARQREVFDGI